MWYYFICVLLFFFKQKTAYEMRISDWSSDVCSSDLIALPSSPLTIPTVFGPSAIQATPAMANAPAAAPPIMTPRRKRPTRPGAARSVSVSGAALRDGSGAGGQRAPGLTGSAITASSPAGLSPSPPAGIPHAHIRAYQKCKRRSSDGRVTQNERVGV